MVLLWCGGCDRDTSSSSTAPSPTEAKAVASPRTATATKNPPDESLPADQYIPLGLPAYDRPWTGQDMTVAAGKLQTLAATAPQQLPRRKSAKSGAMFDRITGRDNLAFFRSQSLPLSARLPQAMEYLQSLNAILKTYLAAMQAGKVSGGELVDLLAAELSVVQVALELVDEFVPTLSKDDPKYPVRMAGLERMRQGLATMVSGTLTALTESRVYDVDSRSRLLARSIETFPGIVPKLTAPSRAEVRRRLDELVDDPSVRELRAQVIELRDAVRRTSGADM
jgi:hypothetical protein